MNEHLIEFLCDLVEHCRTWGDVRTSWCTHDRFDFVEITARPAASFDHGGLVSISVFDRVGHWYLPIDNYPLYRLHDPASWSCAETTDHTHELAAGGTR